HASERAQENCDFAVADRSSHQFLDFVDELSGITLTHIPAFESRFLVCIRIGGGGFVFWRDAEQELNESCLMSRVALFDAGFVFDIAKLSQFFGRYFGGCAKDLREDEIQRVDERLLTAEVQVQRLWESARLLNCVRHFPKHINVCAAKSVD